MDFSRHLAAHKKAIDKQLEQTFNKLIKENQKKDALITECLKHAQKIALAGGKRIRGALLMNAYFGFGGKEKQKILKVATAIELVHLFLLMHDDIIDRGDLRHGQMTLHKKIAEKYAKKNQENENVHFGESLAIIVGDMLYAVAFQMLAEAGFEAEITVKALGYLQQVVNTTIIGQSQDIFIAFGNTFEQKEILKMYENKTARYTFEGPLHLGAILASCSDKKSFKMLSEYALLLGVAFQIQDDILGVFGNEQKMGKNLATDIEEGKKTLLVAKALEFANKNEQKQILAILGKKQLKVQEIMEFQDILKKTGALAYNEEDAKKMLFKGKESIAKLVMLGVQKEFLLELITYLENRRV